ncbi:MAG TPA: sigma-70 family RNA polymerase sigma factor [Bdellovibrionota bacterium]|jgi:RNA polymerase sigma-70 factor (ECF subfamily)
MDACKSDEELMVAYQLGEADAFAELYARHAPQVFGFLRKKVRSEALASDIFQATFLKLHKSRSRYDASYAFLPWLFTICRSELLDALKKRSQTVEVPVPAVPEPLPMREEDRPEINLGALPLSQRRAVELRYGEEFSFEQIAAQLETSPANARKLVSRAVQFLRGSHAEK